MTQGHSNDLKNAEIIFTQTTVSYKKEKYTPELIIRANDKYILVNKNIKI